MKTLNWLSLFILLAIVLTPIGIVLGFQAGTQWNRGAFTPWLRLPDPPVTPVQIVDGSSTVVYIEASDGQVYSCSWPDNQCWVEDEKPVTTTQQQDNCDYGPLQYSVSAPPGKVTSYLKTQCSFFELGEESDYAILEDGSAWVWNHRDATGLNLTRLLAAAGGGGGLGLLASLAIPVLIRLWRRRQRDAGVMPNPNNRIEEGK